MSDINLPLRDGTITNEQYAPVVEKHKEKLEDLKLKELAAPIANQNPFPGPTLDAFDNNGNLIVNTSKGEIPIRPLVSYDLILLKKLDSPIYKQLIEAASDPSIRQEVEFDDDDAFILIYQFIHPIEDSIKLIRKGKETYQVTAISTVAKFSLIDVSLLMEATIKQILSSTATATQYDVKASDDGDKIGSIGSNVSQSGKKK